MDNNESILVSVYVITYNSSKYVMETLESIKIQTYPHIELIISDDCSTDNTLDLCEKWTEENKTRFINVQILTFSKNTGVSANCNRAIKASKGTWIKGIAGDDVLMPNCIYDNLNYATLNQDVFLVQSDNVLIDEDSKFIQRKINFFLKYKLSIFNDKRISANDQHKLLLYASNIIPATLFIKRELFQIIGEYDESIPMMEDRPFFLKATKMGFKFHYFSQITVKYRKHSNSIMSQCMQLQIINKNHLSFLQVSEKYLFKEIDLLGVYIKKYHASVIRTFYSSKINIRTRFNKLIFNLLVFPHNLYNFASFFLLSLKIKRRW